MLVAASCACGVRALPAATSTWPPPSAAVAYTVTADPVPDVVELLVKPGGTPITFDLPPVTPPPDFVSTGELHWPLPQDGALKKIYIWPTHPGIDVAVPEGTPVLAADNGVVALAEFNEVYGNLVVLDHGNGLQTWYGHLAALEVKVTDAVRQGARLGPVGSTGASSALHLHFEVRLDGRPLPPLARLANPPKSIVESSVSFERRTATAIAVATQTALAFIAGQTATAQRIADLTRAAAEQTRAAQSRTPTGTPSQTPTPTRTFTPAASFTPIVYTPTLEMTPAFTASASPSVPSATAGVMATTTPGAPSPTASETPTTAVPDETTTGQSNANPHPHA